MNPTAVAVAAALPSLGWAVHARVWHKRLNRARRCPVTGVLTRDGWTRAADVRSTRTLILLDLDGFKPVNDEFGHEAGDVVLTVTADRITAWAALLSGVVGRLGGDEFVIALPGRGAPLGDLAALLAEPVPSEWGPLPISASVGGAYRARHQPLGQVLRAADDAMYDAKRERTVWKWAPDTPHVSPGDGAPRRTRRSGDGPQARVR
jgi:diguanylate cyclase (GGDEF)-like protein